MRQGGHAHTTRPNAPAELKARYADDDAEEMRVKKEVKAVNVALRASKRRHTIERSDVQTERDNGHSFKALASHQGSLRSGEVNSSAEVGNQVAPINPQRLDTVSVVRALLFSTGSGCADALGLQTGHKPSQLPHAWKTRYDRQNNLGRGAKQ
eukprot:gene13882-19808_t